MTPEQALQAFCTLLGQLSGVTVLIAYGDQARLTGARIEVRPRQEAASGYPEPPVGTTISQRMVTRFALHAFEDDGIVALKRARTLLRSMDARVTGASVAILGMGDVMDMTADYHAAYERRAVLEVQIGWTVLWSDTQPETTATQVDLAVNGATFEDVT